MRFRPLLLLCGVLAFVLAVGQAVARPSAYTVRRGDTLTSIAKRHGVKVSELRRWNQLHKDRIRPGDTLHLRATARQVRVRKGDTLSRIAKREGIKTKDLIKLNPGLKPSKIRVGQVIELPGAPPTKKSGKRPAADKPGAKPKQKKLGTTALARQCPALLAQIPGHVGYKRVHRDAAWATAKVNDALRRGFNHVLRRHRLAPRVHVLDGSRRDLGPVGDHRSHQSGRDVDITYYQKRCPRDGCPTRRVRPSQLDVKRQWTLLHYWLRNGDIDMMFISHKLQGELRAYAKKKGVPESKLDEWFQYPHRPGTQGGLIRHWSGHENHIHLRFRSPTGNNRTCPKR